MTCCFLTEGVAASLKIPRHRRTPRHRVRRQRMPRAGKLVQVDGSHHRWLGDHGPPFTLLLAVDDATGIMVNALFCKQENTRDYFLLMRGLVQRHDIPIALYTDRHSVFKNVPGPGRAGAPTQFSRAMDELGVQMVFALSPQAKGRVERTAGTFQDRLVTELRLAGAVTLEAANAVLEEFLNRFNTRLGVPARHPEAAYRPLGPDVCLGRVLCFRHSRRVARDNTVKYRWKTLQLLPGGRSGAAMRERWQRSWKAWTASSQCVTRERSSPARRRHPARAYSEASTALPHTGHPHMAVATIWAGAGRRPPQHSTPEWTSPMLTTRPSTTALPESASHLPCNAASPPRFRRQGGTPFRRRSAGGCRFAGSHENSASIVPRQRNTWRL